MPPRCCALLQIHVALDDLSPQEARDYREKFEEWISPTKNYCPAPTCSAFISERQIPHPPAVPPKSPSPLPAFLEEILTAVGETSSARFFRGEMDITQLPGYSNVVERPIDLGKISANVPRYDSVKSLTLDMQLLVSNAVCYNGPGHPVSKAAEDLFKHYLEALSVGTQRVLETPPAVIETSPAFACPKCHIAICTSCKQIEHGDTPCDQTSADQELAMLESFGYKRCPRCKAGVKKMYGCSHMQCLCGAHWCYRCQRSIDECDGACSGEDEEDDEEEYYSDEDPDGEVDDEPPPRLAPAAAGEGTADAPPNLDAGGGGRWADGLHDFGDEPEEAFHMQVWSCSHKFSHYRIVKEDALDRGDYLSMECNRCFTKVAPRPPALSPRTMMSRTSASSKDSSYGKWMRAINTEGEQRSETAWECSRCRVVTCESCKRKYEAAKREVD